MGSKRPLEALLGGSLLISALALAPGCAGHASGTSAVPPSASPEGPARAPRTREAELPALPTAGPRAIGPADPAGAAGAEARPVAPPLPRDTSVLHVGDSFVLAGFSQGLRARMHEVGARYRVKSEQSSYTVTWAARLEQLLAETRPDLVIITLGANEVANVNPPAHAAAVRRIARLIGDRPCVWVLPPLWRKDTGIIDVIRQNSAPCRLFDSDVQVRQPIPRQSDKIHPTTEGGQIWADAFWAWLEVQRASAAPSGPPSRPWALGPATADEHGGAPRRDAQASSAIESD